MNNVSDSTDKHYGIKYAGIFMEKNEYLKSECLLQLKEGGPLFWCDDKG